MSEVLKKKAELIFAFFVRKNIGDLFLYFDQDFNDYYIVVEDDIYDTEKFKKIINEYMRAFDISNFGITSKKYIISLEDLSLVDKFIDYTQNTKKTHYNIELSFSSSVKKISSPITAVSSQDIHKSGVSMSVNNLFPLVA